MENHFICEWNEQKHIATCNRNVIWEDFIPKNCWKSDEFANIQNFFTPQPPLFLASHSNSLKLNFSWNSAKRATAFSISAYLFAFVKYHYLCKKKVIYYDSRHIYCRFTWILDTPMHTHFLVNFHRTITSMVNGDADASYCNV